MKWIFLCALMIASVSASAFADEETATPKEEVSSPETSVAAPVENSNVDEFAIFESNESEPPSILPSKEIPTDMKKADADDVLPIEPTTTR